MKTNFDILYNKGNRTVSATIKSGSLPFDLTGQTAVIRFGAQPTQDVATVYDLEVACVIAVPSSGVVEFTITAAHTVTLGLGVKYGHIYIKDGGGIITANTGQIQMTIKPTEGNASA